MAPTPDRGLADLVRERGADLTAYACLLTGDRAAAQDLVQDAIVKVFARTRRGFVPDVAEAYVRRTMLTLYIDGYRRRRHWTAVRHLVTHAPQSTASPESAVTERLALRAALDVLAPQERACVVLRFYEDLTVPEIADRMGISAGAVKRYLSNAMRKLETELGPGLDTSSDDEDVAVVSTHPSVTTVAARRRP